MTICRPALPLATKARPLASASPSGAAGRLKRVMKRPVSVGSLLLLRSSAWICSPRAPRSSPTLTSRPEPLAAKAWPAMFAASTPLSRTRLSGLLTSAVR